MNINILAGMMNVEQTLVTFLFFAFGIFGWGRIPNPDTLLDAEEVAATLRLGINDLCDADRRSDGWSRVDPSIALEDVILASRIAEILGKEAKNNRGER